MKNIVLIGMPGCGKSTLGRLLSIESKLKFIDLDEYVVEKNSMTIEEMFNKGEEFFRDMETKAVEEASKGCGVIISTGGGVVKREANIKILRKNGFIIFIDRSIEKIIETLDSSKRPLLKDNVEKIYSLYSERYELYKQYSDAIIFNNREIEEALNNIKLIMEKLE